MIVPECGLKKGDIQSIMDVSEFFMHILLNTYAVAQQNNQDL